MLAELCNTFVLAQGAACPVLDTFREAFAYPWNGNGQRGKMADMFGFDKGVRPDAFTTTAPVPDNEKQYFLANLHKVIGFNPMWINTIGLDLTDCVTTDVPSNKSDETDEEKSLFVGASKIRHVPIKIWHNQDDPTVPFRMSKYFVGMCRRGGNLAELRPFPSGGHNAWDNGESVQIETQYGGTMTVSASVYELYCWFKRFD